MSTALGPVFTTRPADSREAAPAEVEEALGLSALAPLLAFCLYLVLKPFYFFPSGGPQIADAVVAALAVFLLVRGGIRVAPAAQAAVLGCALFVSYAAVVNLFWAAMLPQLKMLKVPAFYFYNFLLVALALHLRWVYGERFLRYTAWAVAASVLLQAALGMVFAETSSGRRQILFFNNPNQLGYWALLSGSIFFLCLSRVRAPAWLQLSFSVSILYLAALSLSKGALLSLLPLFVLAYSRRPHHVAVACAAGLVLLVAASETNIADNVVGRLENIGEQDDDSFSSRGYDRLWMFPQHLALGAGEGGFERFRRWDYHEFHSTLGTLVFSYGVVGAGLFALFVWRLYLLAGTRPLAFLLPALLFGVAHQGLRFSLLWVLFGVIATLGGTDRLTALEARPLTAPPAPAPGR